MDADQDTGQRGATGPVRLGPAAHVALRPVETAHITGGFWHERRRINAAVSIPTGFERLEEAGNLHNLRLAAGRASGTYGGDLPFLDSDVYKWLEAAGWQLGDGDWPALAERVDQIVALLDAAQQADGYLQSYFQVVRPDDRYVDLQWGHELYCAGHLIQAAIAHARATGRENLLAIARPLADHIDTEFGPDRINAVCGHPEIETALVELYRHTGERRYLALAEYFIDRRGHGSLGDGRFGRAYWQDHQPLRDARTAAGHAVRQLYLLTGAADVYAETGDESLLDAVVRLWEDIVATKTYLTGGMGSHHTDESFGDPYELPSERAYAETCAAIAAVMLSWRLFLITGEARYADFLERVLYNGFSAGVSLDGQRYLYVNPLHVRDGHDERAGDHGVARRRWFRCACCPPNVMRLLASLDHYFAAGTRDELVIHQYASGEFGVVDRAVAVTTDYPWNGRIRLRVTASSEAPWTLTLRIPAWSGKTRLAINGTTESAIPESGWLRIHRAWRPGDVVHLELDLAPRLTTANPRIDATRGCVAVERGPLVYCLEQMDQPEGLRLDDIAIDAGASLVERERPDLLGGLVTVTAKGQAREQSGTEPWWPYHTAGATGSERSTPVELTAIPYHAWANRANGSMRVWIPGM